MEEEGYSLLWVPHPVEEEVFALAQYLATDKADYLIVETNPHDPEKKNRRKLHINPTEVFKVEQIHLQNTVKDITHLFSEVAHPAPALHYFKKTLFHRGAVYVFVNSALFSLNPFQARPRLYGDDNVAKYANASQEELDGLPAHVYNFGKKVFFDMLNVHSSSAPEMLNQTIICSGESGSGKTENAKYVSNLIVKASQQYLASTATMHDQEQVSVEAKARAGSLEEILRYSNTAFESFGNAKTLLNDNASRFGKYMKLQYTKKHQLVSIYTETFFLEKSRLTQVIEGERNYHIFYQLFRGMGSAYPELKQSLRLYAVDDFKMLTSGNCLTMKNVHQDVTGFHETVKALKALGSSEEELRALWTLIAVMLHLGNAVVVPPSASANSDADESGLDESADMDYPCTIQIDTLQIEDVADLLGVEVKQFTSMLTTRGSQHFDAERVQVNIHGFLKHIYKGIYFWIVRKVNHQGAYFGKLLSEPVKFIGVLDVPGNENKYYNSLEQLLINLANERLKGHFNESTFLADKELYMEEGIPCDFINYTDNTDVVQLLTAIPQGIMPILDDQTQKSSMDTIELLTSLVQATAGSSSFEISHDKSEFSVRHFTGSVNYNVDKLLTKNLESTGIDYGQILNSSTNTFLQATLGIGSSVREGEIGHIPWLNNPLVLPTTIATLKTKSISSSNTVWGQFSGQLETMMANVVGTSSHYLKCIRPSKTANAENFSPQYVMEQMKHQGLSDITNMVKEGWPERMGFREFYQRFEELKLEDDWPSSRRISDKEAKSYVQQMAGSLLNDSSFAMGDSYIFTKDGCTEFLEHNLKVFYNANATLIQSVFRRYKCMTKFKKSIKKSRDKKAAAELSKSIISGDGTVKRESIHHHAVNYDVFSAINIMQQKGRRPTSPMTAPVGLSSSPHTLPSALFTHVDDDESDDEDSQHIRRLHEYYVQKMELIKGFIKGVLVRRRSVAIFEAVTSNDQEKVMAMLRKRPELISVLDRDADFRTLQHAALKAGHVDMCKLLGLSPLNILIRDAGDHSCIHYAALKPNLDLYKLFYKTLSTLLGIPKVVAQESSGVGNGNKSTKTNRSVSHVTSSTMGAGDEPSDESKISTPNSKGRLFRMGASDEAFSSPMLSSSLKSPLSSGRSDGREGDDKDSSTNKFVYRMGIMSKINISGRLARRLFVLKDQKLRYYPVTKSIGNNVMNTVNQMSNVKESHIAFSNVQLPEYYTDEYIVNFRDCFFSRYNYKGKEDLAIVLNFSQPSGKKKRTKIIFKANNERELQQWIMNLSQIASFDRFRSYAPRFRNPLFLRAVLTQVTWAKETALHTLVHSAGNKLRKSKAETLKANLETSVDEFALLYEYISTASWLIDHGCPINCKNMDGCTALHLAVEYACYPMALCLTLKGAMVDTKDFNAKTPMDYCDAITPEDLGYDLESARQIVAQAELDDKEQSKGKKENTPALDALDVSVSISKIDAAESKRLEEMELLEQKAAEVRMDNEDLISNALKQATEMGRNISHMLRLEAREYQRLQVPFHKGRLLPSPLVPNMGLRNPYPSPHSSLVAPQKKGYSYLALFIQRHGVEINANKGTAENVADAKNFALLMQSNHLTLSMALYNASTNQLVEPAQELEKPVFRDAQGNFMFWGSNYNVQTPLEFLPDGCYLTFRLFLKNVNPSNYSRKAIHSTSTSGNNVGKGAGGGDTSARGSEVPDSSQSSDVHYDSDDGSSDADSDVSEESFKEMFSDQPLEFIDVDVSRGSLIIDKATIDSGYAKLVVKDHRDSNRIFIGVGGGVKDEDDAEDSKESKTIDSIHFSSLDAYKKGGYLKSVLEFDISVCEYFDNISFKDIVSNNVDNVQAYAPGSFCNNPPHLLGASHDKTLNKTKRGVMKATPELFALSYFEGGASERFHITLPIHARGGDIIKNIGGFPHIDVRVPGHIRGGQNVIVVVPRYLKGTVPEGMPEVYADDFNKNLNNMERLQYQLPPGIAEGPYHVQNIDGSRILPLRITRSLVQKLNANGDEGLSIIIVLNSWVKDVLVSPLGGQSTKSGQGVGLFNAFLDNSTQGGDDFTYDSAFGRGKDNFSDENPMRRQK